MNINPNSVRFDIQSSRKFEDLPHAVFFQYQNNQYLSITVVDINYGQCNCCKKYAWGNAVNLKNGVVYHFCPNDIVFIVDSFQCV